MKIITILGSRPQFIKAAVISRLLKSQNINEIIVHTGQHFDDNMSNIFFKELELPEPDINLGIGGGSHGQNTGRMIENIELILNKEKPDWVLVYGDTDSTLAGSIAAVKLHIPIAHIESGLRSFNRQMPEEINRILTDHVSELLFTPTDTATQNLANEGIRGEKVQKVGDVMYDAILYYSKHAEECSRILEKLNLEPKEYILATVHRAENSDNINRLKNIISGFANANKTVIWPMHPRTKKQLNIYELELPPSIKIIEPVGYLDMIMLEKHASIIATDSGGVQKEAFFNQVHCITLREETEWIELVEAGVNILVGTEPIKITNQLNSIRNIWECEEKFYGEGKAGELIVKTLSQVL